MLAPKPIQIAPFLFSTTGCKHQITLFFSKKTFNHDDHSSSKKYLEAKEKVDALYFTLSCVYGLVYFCY